MKLRPIAALIAVSVLALPAFAQTMDKATVAGWGKPIS